MITFQPGLGRCAQRGIRHRPLGTLDELPSSNAGMQELTAQRQCTGVGMQAFPSVLQTATPPPGGCWGVLGAQEQNSGCALFALLSQLAENPCYAPCNCMGGNTIS